MNQNNSLPKLLTAMNSFGGGSRNAEITKFINLPETGRIIAKLRSLIKSHKNRTALDLACQHVIKYHHKTNGNELCKCLYHGNFVYHLLKQAQ